MLFALSRLKPLFSWMSENLGEGERFEVDWGGIHTQFSFRFPLRSGEHPHPCVDMESEPRFLILGGRTAGRGYTALLESDSFSLYERDIDIPTRPIRLGLSNEEKRVVSDVAREVSGRITAEKDLHKIILEEKYQRLWMKAGAGVSVWVDGTLRGSSVVMGVHFIDAVRDAVSAAVHDARFALLTEEEMTRADVEITLIRTPAVPRSFLEGGAPIENSALMGVAGGRVGWLLPSVLNVSAIRDSREMEALLASEKLGAERVKDMYAHGVESFLSRADGSLVSLLGPVPAPGHAHTDDVARRACSWLVSLQEKNGALPCALGVHAREVGDVGSPAFRAFAGFALARYASAFGDECAREAASRLLGYLLSWGRRRGLDVLAHAYLVRLATALNMSDKAEESLSILKQYLPAASFDPLTHAQVAAAYLDARHAAYTPLAAPLAEQLEKNTGYFYEGKDQYAAWAEAIIVMQRMSRPEAGRMAAYLIAQQRYDGAFPVSGGIPQPSARATAKMYEMLCFVPEDVGVARAKEKCLSWLASFQYDDRSMHHIACSARERLAGGFRSEYGNREAWIDTAAHVLLAAVHEREKEK